MLLNIVFSVLATLAVICLYLSVPTLSLWWLLPLLAAAFVGVVVLYLVMLCVWALFLPKRKPIKKPKAACAFMIRITMEWLMKIFRVRIKLTGRELLPKEPCVLVSNHRSGFDPLTVLSVMKGRKLAYISKEANLKIPVVGNFIYHAGFLAIDRGNGMRAMRTLKQAADLMNTSGLDIGIYPEGTRSKTGELLRFKAGAFLLAQRAEAPVVVMTTRGTEHILKNIPFRPTDVEFRILTVIDRETVCALSREELTARVYSIVEEDLKQ